MSVSVEVPAVIGQKRGPGRPPKSGTTSNKKQKYASIEELRASHLKPQPDKPPRGLPTKLRDDWPLPTLDQPQSLSLPDTEYASIADSGVLAKSLEQSRISWTQNGVFERYWTKPETGKNAKPPPPNNPDVKSMKSRGKCRLRIEPHIFEVEIYVVERPRPPPPKQVLQPRPQTQTWQSQPYQATQTSQQVQGDPKAPPDPVIGLLAARAGSDPELKALMREVAKGNAPPELLRIFQRHIDELNAELRAGKDWQNGVTATTPSDANTAPFQQQPQQYATPPPPGPAEVVFSFTTPGATSDRFLFPQHSILETLTPQHLLTSFLVTKEAEHATNPNKMDVYWAPVTMMVEVAYGRENILKDVYRWVKSPKESREHMEQVIRDYVRMPADHLAIRLPLKGTAGAESSNTSKLSTPVPQIIEDRKRRQSKDTTLAGRKRSSLAKEKFLEPSAAATDSAAPAQPSTAVKVEETASTDVAQAVDVPAAGDRPRRATRKSVRMSDV